MMVRMKARSAHVFRILKIAGMCFVLVYVLWFSLSPKANTAVAYRKPIQSVIDKFKTVRSDRWIVVTTIFGPTPDIKYMATIPGWKIVVVGDRKTPKDWSHPNCTYLSLDDQLGLGFETTPHIPESNYGRKTVGYLFAIAHGAKVIFETDDDNRPLDLLKRFVFDPTMWGLLYKGKKIFNPYRHFGQPTLWPRGYPLGSVAENITQEYELTHWKTPSIQQGVVNGDPDMDAIFRLTRKKTQSILNVTFDGRAPPAILPAGVFSPFNSQNTLFFYDALWALFMSATTTYRVCDIWRGYWAQRLLWEMGGNLGFFPPNTYQLRNEHDYLKDAKGEEDLYYNTERLVDFLSKWRCPLKETFYGCMGQLSTAMVQENFWGELDARLTYLWIKDLKALGYKEPNRIPYAVPTEGAMSQKFSIWPYQTDLTEHHFNVTFWAAEQSPPMIYSPPKASPTLTAQMSQIISYCGHQLVSASKVPITYPNLLLVVVFNWPYYQNLGFLETMYGTHFPHIVYCGVNRDLFDTHAKLLRKPLSFIEVDIGDGWHGHRCLILAMKLQFRVDGYLYIGDDVLLNPWNIHLSPLDRLWVYKSQTVQQSKPVSWDRLEDPTVGLKTYQAALKDLKLADAQRYASFTNLLSKNSGKNDGFFIGASDIVYVPEKYKDDFLYYMEHFSKFNLYLEIIFPTVLRGIEMLKNAYQMPGTYVLDGPLNQTEAYFNQRHLFIHTVKLSKLIPSPEGKKFFCKKFFPFILYG